MEEQRARAGQRPGRTVTLSAHTSSLRWSPDGSWMSALGGGKLQLIRVDRVAREAPLSGASHAWAPDSDHVAVWRDADLRILAQHGSTLLDEYTFTDPIRDLAWARDGQRIAVAFDDGTLHLLSRDLLTTHDWVDSFESPIGKIAVSDRDRIAVAYLNGLVAVWAIEADRLTFVATAENAHDADTVNDLAWMPSGDLATAGMDGTIRIWNLSDDRLDVDYVYEGAEGAFTTISTSSDGELVAALNITRRVHVFDIKRRTLRAVLRAPARASGGLVLGGFRPGTHIVGAAAIGDVQAYTWKVPRHRQRGIGADAQYKNAKVVLVGDSGVGKSGLALALCRQPFVPTESTHGRTVWTMSRASVRRGDEGEAREVLLWDLAGQPGYRLFHRLSLRDVAVGLVVFDGSHESDPFRSVGYWARALDEAGGDRGVVKVLVSARADRGGVSVSRDRIEAIVEKYGFHAFMETSAKSAMGIDQLVEMIESNLGWEDRPVVVAPTLFLDVREFLVSVKTAGRLVVTLDEMLDLYAERPGGREISRQLLETCLQRLETAGLVSRLSLREKWLLQPEALDNYAAWLSIAARQEPDGLGAIAEARALQGAFDHDHLSGAQEEQLMLLTAVEEVVGRGLALRVNTDASGQILVFPSELRTDLPDFPGGYDIEVRFRFGGPVSAIYAAIATGLFYSLEYGDRPRLYRNAAIFFGTDGKTHGIAARQLDEDDAGGEMLVFFDEHVAASSKRQFVRYIGHQLGKLALDQTVSMARVYAHCNLEIGPEYVAARISLGHQSVVCPVCTAHIPMDEYRFATSVDQTTARMVRESHDEKGRQQRLATMDARVDASEYHAFICYNWLEKGLVDSLVGGLREQGIACWQDAQRMIGGDRIPGEIERVILETEVAIIALGPNSMGSFQEHEYYALLQRAMGRRRGSAPLRLIPVLLPGGPDPDQVPPFLSQYLAVDLRRSRLAEGAGPKELAAAVLAPRR